MSQTKLAYSIAEASQVTSLSRRSLQYAIAAGILHAVKVNRRTIIPARSLEKLIQGGAVYEKNLKAAEAC